jgi:hypothetical protein
MVAWEGGAWSALAVSVPRATPEGISGWAGPYSARPISSLIFFVVVTVRLLLFANLVEIQKWFKFEIC